MLKIDSDANFIFFKILPHIRSGVYIHFHDVFYLLSILSSPKENGYIESLYSKVESKVMRNLSLRV